MPTRPTPSAPEPKPASAVDDAELVGRIARHDQAAFEVLMRRHNGKLFRVARAILKDDAEAEDALQDAYLDAYRHINDFRGGARLSTWLTRIVINQAL
ncbi:MAG: RNA polymerase subunit sigma, partial [Betaproteobacteria bacterium]